MLWHLACIKSVCKQLVWKSMKSGCNTGEETSLGKLTFYPLRLEPDWMMPKLTMKGHVLYLKTSDYRY